MTSPSPSREALEHSENEGAVQELEGLMEDATSAAQTEEPFAGLTKVRESRLPLLLYVFSSYLPDACLWICLALPLLYL
jgi:hypothetical protein